MHRGACSLQWRSKCSGECVPRRPLCANTGFCFFTFAHAVAPHATSDLIEPMNWHPCTRRRSPPSPLLCARGAKWNSRSA